MGESISAHPPDLGQGKSPTGLLEKWVIRGEQLCTDCEKARTPSFDPLEVGRFIQKRCPAIFQRGQFLAGNASRQQFVRGRLQSRFGRRRALIEPLQCLSPPGQPDRTERRLAR